MVNRYLGCLRCFRWLGAWAASGAALLVLGACSYMPAQREVARAREVLATVDAVQDVQFSCGGSVLASNSVCADVVMKDGARLRFEQLGFNAFGSTAMNVFVAEAGGLAPRIASCDGVGVPNFHRSGALGHHFQPTLIDVKDAVFRYREVLEEVQYWPQCPQYWEVQDKRGANYRYCARRAAGSGEPPLPENCR
jgi:hypothetical protein